MNKEYRPGSMGEADAKTSKIALIVFAAVYVAIVALFLVPSSLFPHLWFSKAVMGYRIVSIALIIGWFVYFGFSYNDFVKDTKPQPETWIILTVGLALTVGFLAGFNFSL